MQRQNTPNQIYGHDQCARYTQLIRDYEQYAVTGVRIKWIPSNIRGTINPALSTNVGGYLGPMFIYDDINTLNPTALPISGIITRDNTMIRDPSRPWQKYLTLRNYANKG